MIEKNTSNAVLVSGGAGYIGSHAVHLLRRRGFIPVVIDSLVNGHAWAARQAAEFRQGDIADVALVRSLCREYRPVAALHFAAFIEVGESVSDPEKYFFNNRDKAKIFFDTATAEGVRAIVFSSTAAVYGDADGILTEEHPARPVNPYGQSKLEAEIYLRGMREVASVALRYFNVAGAAPEAGLGEAHFPESHLIPRIVLPLIGMPADVRKAIGLERGFEIYGDDYATADGTAVRDYVHVLDLAEAHVAALRYLLDGGASNVFNLGSGNGYSVKQIVRAARETLGRPDFMPNIAPRRVGDPATLLASNEKAKAVLDWSPRSAVADMIASAAAWHRSDTYIQAIAGKMRERGEKIARSEAVPQR